MAGIKTDDTVKETFEEMKMGKKTRWCSFKISDDYKTITADATAPKAEPGSPEEEWVAFAAAVNDTGAPRYAAYMFEWMSADGSPREKIVFIAWVPETAKIKQKMLYGSSKDAIKRALIGIGTDLQVRTRRPLHCLPAHAAEDRRATEAEGWWRLREWCVCGGDRKWS